MKQVLYYLPTLENYSGSKQAMFFLFFMWSPVWRHLICPPSMVYMSVFMYTARQLTMGVYPSTSVLSFINGGILSDYQTFSSLIPWGDPSHRTGSSPPSCLYLKNRLYICGPNCTLKLSRVMKTNLFWKKFWSNPQYFMFQGYFSFKSFPMSKL